MARLPLLPQTVISLILVLQVIVVHGTACDRQPTCTYDEGSYGPRSGLCSSYPIAGLADKGQQDCNPGCKCYVIGDRLCVPSKHECAQQQTCTNDVQGIGKVSGLCSTQPIEGLNDVGEQQCGEKCSCYVPYFICGPNRNNSSFTQISGILRNQAGILVGGALGGFNQGFHQRPPHQHGFQQGFNPAFQGGFQQGGFQGGTNQGGIQSGSNSCHHWCRTPQGQACCCEYSTESAQAVVKPGQCPPVRPSCPPTLFDNPSRQCSSDGDCAVFDKCCFDTCLQHHTCRPPIGLGK